MGRQFRGIAAAAAAFAVGQGATQALSVVAGLFLVRHLSLQAYAQYGLALGFQAVVAVLTDIGFTGTIVPMVGSRKDDRALVGRYIRSAKHLRTILFWALAPLAAAPFLLIMHRQHWGGGLQAALVLCTLITLYSAGTSSCYSVPYVLYGRLREFYLPSVLGGTARLVAYIVLEALRGLNAWTAAGVMAAISAGNAIWFARRSRNLVVLPENDDAATDRELIRYVMPATPAAIFAAFQPQITLFLISMFGGSTVYIAQVAALSRIGALFSVLMTFNIVVLEPRVARAEHSRLTRLFGGLCSATALACAPLVWIAFRHPGAFLWLIGTKYESLRGVIGWVILAACINYLAGLIWIMNRARKWVFWSGSILEVSLLIAVQLLFVILVGVQTTRQAVFLTLAASVCPLIAHGYVTLHGFARAAKGGEALTPEQTQSS